MNKSIIALTVIVAAACGLPAQPAAAQPPALTVHYAPASLGTPAGIARLYRQLHLAAAGVCGDLENPQPLTRLRMFQTCHDSALIAAIAHVGNPRLMAYAAQHGVRLATETLAQANTRPNVGR